MKDPLDEFFKLLLGGWPHDLPPGTVQVRRKRLLFRVSLLYRVWEVYQQAAGREPEGLLAWCAAIRAKPYFSNHQVRSFTKPYHRHYAIDITRLKQVA